MAWEVLGAGERKKRASWCMHGVGSVGRLSRGTHMVCDEVANSYNPGCGISWQGLKHGGTM